MSDAVDMRALLSLEEAQMEGEPDLVVELIDLYLKDASDKLVAMRKAVAITDTASLGRAAHNLRGSSANLGARRMAALCEELEQIGVASFQRAGALLTRLQREFELVRVTFAAERRRRV
jgi:HPt (histidine-containing phosphotransfer) domain-containing protein